MVGLDLKCQLAANNVAKSRMQEMYAEYGPELIDGVAGDMIRYSESVLRNASRKSPTARGAKATSSKVTRIGRSASSSRSKATV